MTSLFECFFFSANTKTCFDDVVSAAVEIMNKCTMYTMNKTYIIKYALFQNLLVDTLTWQ